MGVVKLGREWQLHRFLSKDSAELCKPRNPRPHRAGEDFKMAVAGDDPATSDQMTWDRGYFHSTFITS
jgi:hypothetical protein